MILARNVVVAGVGMSGIPIVNVNNNCSTGSTALILARQTIAARADCVLALGFEQMAPGALTSIFKDRPTLFANFDAITNALVGMPKMPLALRYFGGAGLGGACVVTAYQSA